MPLAGVGVPRLSALPLASQQSDAGERGRPTDVYWRRCQLSCASVRIGSSLTRPIAENLRTFMWNARRSGQSSGWIRFGFTRAAGFNRAEINQLKEIVERNESRLLEAWHEFFGK